MLLSTILLLVSVMVYVPIFLVIVVNCHQADVVTVVFLCCLSSILDDTLFISFFVYKGNREISNRPPYNQSVQFVISYFSSIVSMNVIVYLIWVFNDQPWHLVLQWPIKFMPNISTYSPSSVVQNKMDLTTND